MTNQRTARTHARRHGLMLAGAVVAAFILALSLTASSSAQLPFVPTPKPPGSTPGPTQTARPPQATPRPTDEDPTPPPSAPPSDDPILPGPLQPTPPPGASPPQGSPKPSDGSGADGELELSEEEPGKIPEDFEIPVIPRTRGRNTTRLVELLEPLTQVGMSLTDVLVEGMGRFPVAGLAWYSDDWWAPRFTPKFHLHQGLDIFADFGTPLRSPVEGVVSQLSDGPNGGIGVWIRSRQGISYYFAHLQDRAEGIYTGMPVDVGTVIGTVGDSGNAKGGTPHLHMQIHPGGGAPVPPKPYVDAWLDEAERLAPEWVRARTREINLKRELLRTDRPNSTFGGDAASATFETSMLLTLLDPVGGPVGLLPRLPLAPAHVPPVSERFVQEIVRQRVDGHLLGGETFGFQTRAS